MSILQGHTGPTTRNFKANLEGRDFICGDIHGCYDDLMRQLNQADFNPQTDRVFSLGDLCDRGPKSLETLRLLNKPWFFAVMGNHEQMLFEFFRGALPLSTWSKMGG